MIYYGRRNPRFHRGDLCKYLERFSDSLVCSTQWIHHDSTVVGSSMSLLSVGCRIELYYLCPPIFGEAAIFRLLLSANGILVSTGTMNCLFLSDFPFALHGADVYAMDCPGRLVAHIGIKSSWSCPRQTLQQVVRLGRKNNAISPVAPMNQLFNRRKWLSRNRFCLAIVPRIKNFRDFSSTLSCWYF